MQQKLNAPNKKRGGCKELYEQQTWKITDFFIDLPDLLRNYVQNSLLYGYT